MNVQATEAAVAAAAMGPGTMPVGAAEGAASPSAASAVVSPSASPAPSVRRDDEGSERERVLEDQWRQAGAAGDVERRCEALAKHRRLFPHGRLAERREHLWSRACAVWHAGRP